MTRICVVFPFYMALVFGEGMHNCVFCHQCPQVLMVSFPGFVIVATGNECYPVYGI